MGKALRKAFLLEFVAVGVLALGAGSILLDPSAYFAVGAAEQSSAERLEQLRRMITEEIGEPRATHASQCKLIAFGSKPCGGPLRYLVYSTAKTNEAKLQQLVSEYNQRQKKYNEERGAISDCMFVTEPKVELINGVCKIKQNGARMPQ
jgi:hypothetical protein